MINEKSAVSISLVVILIGIAMFIARIHSHNEQQQNQIDQQRALELDRAIRQYDRLNDLDQRLSRIEGQLSKIEKWCQELVQKQRERK